ncbi:c-type cytochrome [bacterium]|nr:c-type cytochrome [bacterium]
MVRRREILGRLIGRGLVLMLSVHLCVVSMALAEELFTDDITLLGGTFTSFLPEEAAIQVAAPNLPDSPLRDQQLAGFSIFHRRNGRREGLGPVFVHSGCGQCHTGNGKGLVRLDRSGKRPGSMIIKVSLRGLNDDGSPRDLPRIGEQLQPLRLRRKRFVRNRRVRRPPRIRWSGVAGEFPDGEKYRLREPRLRFRVRGIRNGDIVASLRMTPGLVGMGLLEAIPEAQILEWSDPEDLNGDGISGVPNYVPEQRSGEMKIGRFGFRGSHPTLEEQSAAAAFFDMGITSSIFPGRGLRADGDTPELSESDLEILTLYQAFAGVPDARNQGDPEVQRGKVLFQEIECSACHKMNVTTEHPTEPLLSGETIHPFTDLLLHDMGPDLADERAEFSATGSEWRTTPLWGLGHLPTVSRRKQRYLHDGRARSLQEAILWHGGEGAASRDRYKELSRSDRAALLAFLRSL